METNRKVRVWWGMLGCADFGWGTVGWGGMDLGGEGKHTCANSDACEAVYIHIYI